MKVATLGGGSWGTTVAHLCAHNVPTRLYVRDPVVAEAVTATHENPRYLQGFGLHPALRASTDFDEVVDDADVVILGVPSGAFPETLERLSARVRPGVPIRRSVPLSLLRRLMDRTPRT